MLASPEDYPPLKVARCRAGLTQAELAALVGVCKATVVSYEAGERINANNLKRLQEALET